MTHGSVSFPFMGDTNADILKVGHHGSATSSSSAFLSKVHPKISVIEVGPGIPMAIQHQQHWVAWPRWDRRYITPT